MTGRVPLLLVWLLTWIHAYIVSPLVRCWEDRILGTWENVVTAVLRESFAEWTRAASGLSAWFVSLFQQNYRDKLRKAWRQPRSHAPPRPSTLNAILEAMHLKEAAGSETPPGKPLLLCSWWKSDPAVLARRPVPRPL